MALTLTQHIAAVRQFSNTENNTGFVTDTEITSRLNEAISELYDLVVVAFEHYYVSEDGPFTLAGGVGANTHTLPADFYKYIGLDRDPNTTYTTTVPKLPSFAERNRVGGPAAFVQGLTTLVIMPPQAAGGTFLMYYVPKAPTLVDPTDTLDVNLAHWEEFIDIRAAVAVCNKREMTEMAQTLEAKLQALTLRIHAMAANRTEEPSQVALADNIGRRWWGNGEDWR
jgi:hypothetical protein